MRTRAARGFTLVELLLVLAVLSILAAMTTPRFATIRSGWRLEETVRTLASDLHRAKFEAIRRGYPVALAPPDFGGQVYKLVVREANRLGEHHLADRHHRATLGVTETTLLTRAIPNDTRLTTSDDGLEFLPDGSSTAGWITLATEQGSTTFRLEIDPVLGEVKVRSDDGDR